MFGWGEAIKLRLPGSRKIHRRLPYWLVYGEIAGWSLILYFLDIYWIEFGRMMTCDPYKETLSSYRYTAFGLLFSVRDIVDSLDGSSKYYAVCRYLIKVTDPAALNNPLLHVLPSYDGNGDETRGFQRQSSTCHDVADNISHFISFHFTSSWLNDSVFYDRLKGVRDRAELGSRV